MFLSRKSIQARRQHRQLKQSRAARKMLRLGSVERLEDRRVLNGTDIMVSFIRDDASPTNASTLHFSAVFNHALEGVGVEDFDVAAAEDGASGVVTVVDDAGDEDASTYRVTVDNVTGNGLLGLDLSDNHVFSPIGDELVDFVPADEAYVIDNDAPNITDSIGTQERFNNIQPYQTTNYIIALQGIAPSRSAPSDDGASADEGLGAEGSEPFIGEIALFGGNFAPPGWAFADGQLLPISQNTALFSILGTTYGGDGRTTFALPDLRGRVPVGAETGPGLPQQRLGQRSGAETNVLNSMPRHHHTVENSEDQGDKTGDAGSAPPTIGLMQPSLALNYIIALQGTFPSRTASVDGSTEQAEGPEAAEPFIGEIRLFAGNFAPRGWALAEGQLLPVSQNDALFSILGTAYGGDGETTFALPDLRGRTAVHAGGDSGLGARGGRPGATLDLIPHAHTGPETNSAGDQPVEVNIHQPTLAVNYVSNLYGIYPSRTASGEAIGAGFVGEIGMFAGTFAPTGTSFTNGQLLSISENDALFSLYGTTYGGDGETTFGLPNFQNRTVIHPGRGPGLSEYRLGQKGGSDSVTLTANNLPAHAHTLGSIKRQDPMHEGNAEDSAVFRVQFTESVAFVDENDFRVNLTDWKVDEVLEIDPATYDVRVVVAPVAPELGAAPLTPETRLGLDFSANQNVADLAGNVYPGGEPPIDQTYLLGDDNEAPEVTITSPGDGEQFPLGASFTVEVQATDNDLVSHVELTFNGEIVSEDPAPNTSVGALPPEPGSHQFFVTMPPVPGSYEIVATAFDRFGNVGSSTVSVIGLDDIPPEVEISTPSDNEPLPVGVSIPIDVNADDNVGVAGVEVWVNGESIGTDDTSPYEFSFEPNPGENQIEAVAFDEAGNAHFDQITVIGDTPPDVTFLSPADGDSVVEGQEVLVSLLAFDDFGINHVDLQVDGDVVGSSYGNSYEFTFIAPNFDDAQSVELVATAIDTLGQMTQETIVINVTEAPAVIIDNSDDGFADVGRWTTVNRNGHEGGFQFAHSGTGDNTATWTFDVERGEYDVSASYREWTNRATAAPYTVFDGASSLGTVEVNQQEKADSVMDEGTWFKSLGTFIVSGNQLIVQLDDSATGLTIADAIRVQRVGDITDEPEIRVNVDGTEVADDTGEVDFGAAARGTTVSKPVIITNISSSPLMVDAPLTLPAGFSVDPEFTSATLPPGQSITFDLILDTSDLGTFSGEVSFETNDGDENPFNFQVQATVVEGFDRQILDDSDLGSGFELQGNWATINRNGHEGGFQIAAPGDGTSTAEWAFNVPAGDFRVSVAYRHHSAFRATDATFTVRDGDTLIETVIDQHEAPDDILDEGTWFRDLGTFRVDGNQLVVQLDNDADGHVIADAIRIERVNDLR